MSADRERTSRAWRDHALVVLAYALLALLMTWPLVTHLRSAVPGPPGDNLEYVWKLWWFREAITTPGVSPYFNPDVFFPFGYPLALSETTLTHTVLGMPLTLVCGEVAAYNLMMLLSFIWAGYATWLLCRRLGSGPLAALVGGAVFAFAPYRLSHMGAGHLPLMGTGWIAMLFWSLEGLLERPTWRRGLWVGMAYGLMALSSWYYAAMVGMFSGLFMLLRARPWRERLWHWPLWRSLLLGGALCALILVPALGPMMRVYGQGQASYDASLAYLDRWSASPLDFVYPNAMHSLWGAKLTRAYYQNINENLLYLGLVALVLTGFGIWSRRREAATRVYIWLGVIAMVLALGMTLHWAGDPVYLRVPEAVEDTFARGMYALTGKWALNKARFAAMRRPGAIVLPLPTLLLYLFVPFINAMRVWTRFGVVTLLTVSVLAAWGLDAIQGGMPSRTQSWVAAGALLLVLADFCVVPYPYGRTLVAPQPLDQWLAEQPGEGAVAQFPLHKTWFGWMLDANRIHGRPLAYGYGTFAPEAYTDATVALEDWPSEDALAVLRDWGVRYVVMGARSYETRWPETEGRLAELPIEEVAVFEDTPRFVGDRLLHLSAPTEDVPSTLLIRGVLQVYLDDENHVYDIQ